ncbi:MULTISPECIES: tyrosine-type recombinase/integrase [unclassified Coleofasciculus]|uniref:tyrosine-type recombinase/integrase n=1 Tax=unclassified Coleofasciculus TaxID=2692782 RepID=UPI001880602A|nr:MULTISPECIES: tyrosine-type recombinase/integrase [unclassified Coleofasciculus]MBE9124749.1 tyrosine-type recombinase/integrase [Coleofasciculus sp. LEGE 07081]MBE9148201.1 tyrosine-type recombinase/integrase [Coleofasciculus sp. LEGE 07092]
MPAQPDSSSPSPQTPAPIKSAGLIDLRYVRVEEFLKARSLTANSQKAYRRELRRFLAWTERPWSQITPRQIVQYKEHLEKSLAESSVNRALSALKSFFGWLLAAYPDSLATNPTSSVALNKLPSPPAFDLLESEVEALVAAVEQLLPERQYRETALVAVLLHGLRAGEVAALNLGDYDGIRLTIRQGKDDSGGTVPLNRQARECLNAYLKERRHLGERYAKHRPLFLSQSPVPGKGERLGYQGIYYTIKGLGQLAGIENLTPHRLRHTYATKLLLKGIDSLHARTLTRHKSEANFKRYAKRALSAAAERAFYEAIGEEPPTL